MIVTIIITRMLDLNLGKCLTRYVQVSDILRKILAETCKKMYFFNKISKCAERSLLRSQTPCFQRIRGGATGVLGEQSHHSSQRSFLYIV